MNASPTGYLLILNNKEFYTNKDQITKEMTRKGTEKDVASLRKCFLGLGYAVEVKENLTGVVSTRIR